MRTWMLGLGLMALATAAGCGTYEEGATGRLWVDEDTDCPPPSTFWPYEGVGPGDIASISPGVKMKAPVVQRCCYDGVFEHYSSRSRQYDVEETVCTIVFHEDIPAEGDASWCPTLAEGQPVVPFAWSTADKTRIGTPSVYRLDAGPYLDGVSPDAWVCEYDMVMDRPAG